MTASRPAVPVTDDAFPTVALGSWSPAGMARVTRMFGLFAAGDDSAGASETGHAGSRRTDRPRPATRHLPADVAADIDPDRFDATIGSLISGATDGVPWVTVSLGDANADIDAGFLAGVAAVGRARDLMPSTLIWHLPPELSDAALRGLVQGTLAALHTPDRFRTERPEPVAALLIDDPDERADLVTDVTTISRACQHARDLQNAPANLLTPRTLASRAEELAARHEHLTATVLDGEEIERRGMGAFAAVARGSAEPARLIALRYEPPGAKGPCVGWVGKGVTFDAGGINLKRSGPGIGDMKFDMSGAAAVIEAVGAVADLGLPVRVVAVAGATENMPGGHATRPGDIVRASDGTTIEITNTDAEGRLVLADCLAFTRSCGAERLVDIATLTGSVVTMFGGRYGALMSNDDGWASTVVAAGERSGDRVWRLPLHPWYAERLRGRYSDVVNCRSDDNAGTIIAGEFLHRFVGDVPWAHVDALCWDLPHQRGLEGGAAYGVRLLVEIASAMATT